MADVDGGDGGAGDWDDYSDYAIFSNVSAIPPGYGNWALTYPDCAVASFPSASLQALQLTWAILCVIQGVFMMSRYPRVSWEPMYIPFVEAVCYGMQSSGFGFLRLLDGRLIPWARYVGWIVTTPVILNQVNQLGRVRYIQWNMNTLAIPFDLLMIAFGLSANLMQDQGLQWLLIFFSFVFYCAVHRISIEIFLRKSREFSEEGSREARFVANRIRLLASVFVLSWTVYPILHVLGPQTLCLIGEDTQAGLHILADFFAKNIFTLIEWATVWGCLDGTWTVDGMHARLGTKSRLTEAQRAAAENKIWRATSAEQGVSSSGYEGHAGASAQGRALQGAASRVQVKGHSPAPLFDTRPLQAFARGLLLPASLDRSHMSSRSPNTSVLTSQPPRRAVHEGAFSPHRPVQLLEGPKPQGGISPQATLRQLAALERQTQIQRQTNLSQRAPVASSDVQGLNLLYQDMLRRLETPSTLSSPPHHVSSGAALELQDLNAVARRTYGGQASPRVPADPPRSSPRPVGAGYGLAAQHEAQAASPHATPMQLSSPPARMGEALAGHYGAQSVTPMQRSSPPALVGDSSSFYDAGSPGRNQYGGVSFQARAVDDDRRKIDLLAQRLERMRQRLPKY